MVTLACAAVAQCYYSNINYAGRAADVDEAAERPAHQPPPRRTEKTVKMRTISRAEGGRMHARVRPQHQR